MIPFGMLYMGPLQWWLRTKGFSQRGNPLSHDQGHAAMHTCLGNVKETLVPVPGSCVGSFMSSQDADDRCFSHGLGSDLRGMLKSGSLEGPSSLMAHQPSGDVGCISCSQDFPSISHGPPCTLPLRQHIGGHLHKYPGGFVVTSTLQTGVPNPPVSQGKLLSLRAAYIPGVHNIGADILSRQGLRPGEWTLHPEVVELIWREFGQAQGDLFASQETSHYLLWFSLTHSALLGLDAMVQTWPRLRLYAFPGESSPGLGSTTSHCPAVAGQSMVPRYDIPSRRASSGVIRPSQAGGSIFHPQPELWKLWAWPLRGPSS